MRRSSWIALAAVLAATAIAYHAVCRGGFVYDDLALVQSNPTIRSFANIGDWFTRSFWRDVYNPADSDHIPYYRPVVTCVLALGHALGGDSPLAYHLIDLALHLTSTALVFFLAIRFLGDSPRALAGAAAAGLAFGLHPAHTEDVAWVSGVSDVVATALALGASICCLRASDLLAGAGPSGGAARSRIAAFLTGGFFLALLAFLAKESALALPFAVAAADWLIAEKVGIRRALPWLAVLAAAAAYMAARVGIFGPRAGFDITQTDMALPDWRYRSLRIELFANYLQTLAWPFDLNAFRPLRVDLTPDSPEIHLARWITGGAALGGAILAALAARHRAARAPLAFVLVMALTILPQIASPRSLGHFVFADRYLYIPSIGFCWLLGWAFAKAAEVRLGLAILLFAPWLCAYGWKTLERVPVWSDERSLFTQSAIESPDCATVRLALGRLALDEYQRSGDAKDLDAAFARFASAIEQGLRNRVFVSNQDVLQAYLGLASIHMIRHRVEEALSVYQQAIDLYPSCEEAHMLAGVALAQLGNLAQAESQLKRAIELRPTYGAAHYNLANYYFNQNQLSLAEASARDALRIEARNVETRQLLGTILANLGKKGEAAEVLRPILEQNPNHPSAARIRAFLESLR